jgi:hypothetical protein
MLHTTGHEVRWHNVTFKLHPEEKFQVIDYLPIFATFIPMFGVSMNWLI